jgi:hypothetical protein
MSFLVGESWEHTKINVPSESGMDWMEKQFQFFFLKVLSTRCWGKKSFHYIS